jgi:hypothetical protein
LTSDVAEDEIENQGASPPAVMKSALNIHQRGRAKKLHLSKELPSKQQGSRCARTLQWHHYHCQMSYKDKNKTVKKRPKCYPNG